MKKVILYILCCCLGGSVALGQQLSDLCLKLKKSDKNTYFNVIMEMDTLLKEMRVESALSKTNEIIEIAQNLDFPDALPAAHWLRARLYETSKPNKAIEVALQAYDLAKQHKIAEQKAFIAQYLGGLYVYEQVFEVGLPYILEAVEYYKRTGKQERASQAAYSLGIIRYQSEEYDEALNVLLELTKNYIRFLKSRERINTWNAIGLCHRRKKNYLSAINAFHTGLQLAQKENDTLWVSLLNGNIGESYLFDKKYTLARPYLLFDVEHSLKVKELQGNASIGLYYLGDWYKEQNQYQEAKKCYDSSWAVSLRYQEKDPEVKTNIVERLADIYEKLALYQQASSFWKLTLQYRDSLSLRKKNFEIRKITAIHNVENIEREIKRIREASALKQQKALLQRWFIIAFFIFLVTLLITLWAFYTKQRNKNYLLKIQNDEIQQQQEEIASQNQHLGEVLNTLTKGEILLKDRNKQLSSYSEKLEDIVGIRTVELQEKNQELIRYNNQLEQFAFAVAHNLRSPAARILGLLSILDNDQPQTTHNQFIIKKVSESARELDEIIKDLNVLLEVQRNLGEIIEEVDLEDKLAKVFRVLDIPIQEGNINTEVLLQVKKIYGVGVYVESIFYNLLSNSIKYRNPDKVAELRISSVLHKEGVMLTISDNGLGIDLKRDGEKLFSPYKRFHSHVEGKGLGLHLVKIQVEAMGGDIEVKSTLMEGTTFEIYFKKALKINET